MLTDRRMGHAEEMQVQRPGKSGKEERAITAGLCHGRRVMGIASMSGKLP